MKYSEFRAKVSAFPVIDTGTLKLQGIYSHSLKVQLLRWHKRGEVIRLRKNLYVLKEEDRKIRPSRLFLASRVYSPSYVSMEYALSLYGLIPEKVVDITCITTKKTAIFMTPLGLFSYRHIKDACFRGFVEQKDEAGLSYFIALPEKAIVDFIYLNMGRFAGDYENVLRESFRVQSAEMLKKNRLIEFVKQFNSSKLEAIVKSLNALQR